MLMAGEIGTSSLLVAPPAADLDLGGRSAAALLDTAYQRLSGRRGPGAGRPTKMYQRSARQVSVTLPERRYDLAGQLLAQAIDDATRQGTPVLAALHAAAAELGATLGDQVRDEMGPRPGAERRIAATCDTLAAHGYEPRREGDSITMANCPSTRWPAPTPSWSAG